MHSFRTLKYSKLKKFGKYRHVCRIVTRRDMKPEIKALFMLAIRTSKTATRILGSEVSPIQKNAELFSLAMRTSIALDCMAASRMAVKVQKLSSGGMLPISRSEDAENGFIRVQRSEGKPCEIIRIDPNNANDIQKFKKSLEDLYVGPGE